MVVLEQQICFKLICPILRDNVGGHFFKAIALHFSFLFSYWSLIYIAIIYDIMILKLQSCQFI